MAIISKYLFDSTFHDSVGSVHGTASGGMFPDETDGERTVAVFDGTDDYIDFGSDFRFDTEDFSFSMWVKPQSAQGEWARIMGTLYNDPIRGWAFEQEGAQTNRYRFQSFDGISWTESDPNNTMEIAPNVWSHLVITRSGTVIKGYLNGEHVYTAATHATMVSTHNFQLGTNPAVSESDWASYWAGSVDEFTVHDAALSDEEVQALYANDPLTPVTVSLTFTMVDSYGDGWNGSTFEIYNADSVAVKSLTLVNGTGPEVVSFDLEIGDYTWAFVNQNWMSEVTATLTNVTADPDEQILFSSGGNVLTGAFTLASNTADISPTLAANNGEITISATLNALAQASASGWAYALDDIFVVGQAHGGNPVDLGADATVDPGSHGIHTVYVAAIDGDGLVIVANSADINNSPTVEVEISKMDTYGDGWNGTMLVITNSEGVEVYNATLDADDDTANVPVIYAVDLQYGIFSWELQGGNYPEEQEVTIRLADGTVLAHSAAHSPSSGSFEITAPAPSIGVAVAVSGLEITASGTVNAMALVDGAANWSASLSDFGEVGETIDGSKTLTALDVDAVLTAPSDGTHTTYAAVVDAAGVILAKGSADAVIDPAAFTASGFYDASNGMIVVGGSANGTAIGMGVTQWAYNIGADVGNVGDDLSALPPRDLGFMYGYPQTTPGSYDIFVYALDASGLVVAKDSTSVAVVGDVAKIFIQFTGALYTSSIVIKKDGEYFAGFSAEPAAWSNNYYHADLLAAREAGKLIVSGDANAHNTDGNGTPKGSSIGIMTATDGGGPMDVVGYTFNYDMDFPPGDYEIQIYPGVENVGDNFVRFSDANGSLRPVTMGDEEENSLLALGGFDATYQSFTIPAIGGDDDGGDDGGDAPPVDDGSYDWTHDGYFSGIVAYENGYTPSGNRSHMLMKNDDGDMVLYFTLDLDVLESYIEINPEAIDWFAGEVPTCAAFGPNGFILLGTESGKLVEIELNDDSLPITFSQVYEAGHPIQDIHFSVDSDSWIISYNSCAYTMPFGGVTPVLRFEMAAGSIAVDFSAAPEGVVMVVRNPDFTFSTMFAMNDWSEIYQHADMEAAFAAFGATNVDYNAERDVWSASNAEGAYMTASDLAEWLQS